MSKKIKEEKVENTFDATQEVTAEDVALNQPVSQVEDPGHTTRAFRK